MNPHAPGPSSALRRHLDGLAERGGLTRVTDEVAVHEVSALIASTKSAIVFESVRGYAMPLAANVMASRLAWASALGVEPAQVRAEITRRARGSIAPVEVDSAGIHEVIQTGDAIDLTTLPAYLQHSEDGGPYISAAMDVSKSPSTGAANLGVRRLMVRGRAETGVDVVAPSDLRAYYREARERGERFEVAFVVGGHPLDYLASQLKLGQSDDWALAGALRGSPVPLVRGRTVDLLVPAEAEMVIEGYFDGDWTELEGPYGEYHGALGPPHRNPVFKVTAITRREDAIFQSATIGNPSLGHTDTAMIAALKSELMVWEALERSIAAPIDVYCPPAAGGRHHVRIQITNRDPGDSRNALYAALSCQADLKLATVVDGDIDIADDEAMEWAMSTRFQAATDLVVLDGLRTLPLEPSLDKSRQLVTTSKLGIDATKDQSKDPKIFAASRALEATSLGVDTLNALPREDQLEHTVERLSSALATPRTFAAILRDVPGVHQRDLLCALGKLREAGLLHIGGDGSYSLVEK